MKKRLNSFLITCFCCIFLFLLLFQSKECIKFASNGLLIWYRNMIPSLFPFMVLSGFIIRSGLSIKIGQYMQPFLGTIFRLPAPMLYTIFMGFLCGFPMGAKIVADMLEKEQITQKEGEYLLSFCNNIGPLYMLGYVIPLFGYKNIGLILGWMYLIPFGYGLYLRHFSKKHSFTLYETKYTSMQNPRYFYNRSYTQHMVACSYPVNNLPPSISYLSCFQQSLSSAIEQITLLGGCMVFFNCLLIFPQMLNVLFSQTSLSYISPILTAIFSSLIEIGGGLQQLASSDNLTDGNIKFQHFTSFFALETPDIIPLLPLALLSFGGLSCIAQTCFILKKTGLKISTYIKHKFIQSCIFILLMFLL